MDTILFIVLLMALTGILVWAYRQTLSQDELDEEFIREYMIPSLRAPSLSDEEDPEKK